MPPTIKINRNTAINGDRVTPIALTTITVLVFLPEFTRLIDAWINDPYVRYGFLIPLISAYLLYKKRKKISRDLSDLEKGAVLALVSIPLLYLTRTYGDLSLAVVAFLPFVFGAVLATYAVPTVREAWFPLAYLGFMFPFPAILTTRLSLYLADLTYSLTLAWLKILGITHTATSEGLPTITVFHSGEPLSFAIDTSCVAVYSLLGFLAFGAFFAYTTSGRIYKRVVLVLVGCLVLILLNSLRIAAILGLAALYGEGLAVTLFHLLGGWVLIAISFIVVLIVAERSGERITL